MRPVRVICSTALALTSWTGAIAEGSQILSPLGGQQDNALISKIESRNPGALCAITPADGHARLMSYGSEAVVDIDGTPIVLAYHPKRGGAEFAAKAIKISGNFRRERVTGPLQVVSHDVTVQVQAGSRSAQLTRSGPARRPS